MKNKLKYISTLLFTNIVFAAGGDYPDMKINNKQINSDTLDNVADAATNAFGLGYTLLKWIWIFLFTFTLISTVISAVRMSIHAGDHPTKKDEAKHDFMTSLIMLAILGGMGLFFRIILAILNKTF